MQSTCPVNCSSNSLAILQRIKDELVGFICFLCPGCDSRCGTTHQIATLRHTKQRLRPAEPFFRVSRSAASCSFLIAVCKCDICFHLLIWLPARKESVVQKMPNYPFIRGKGESWGDIKLTDLKPFTQLGGRTFIAFITLHSLKVT